MFAKWVYRELLRSWKFGLFFIFNLSLGLTGYIALEAFKVSLENTMNANAKAILSSDLAISIRRELSDDEKNQVQKIMSGNPLKSEVYEFFAMLSSAKGSRLVMVRAIDANYPIYGSLTLASGTEIKGASEKEILKSDSVWIYPELRSQLGLVAGDEVELGKLKLKINDIVEKEGTQTFRAAAIAPRVFINKDLIPKSGLIQYGSTFTLSYFYKTANDQQTETKKTALLAALKDPAVRVDTAKSSGEESGRQLGYLQDYLGLVAIVALFMSALGAAYLFRLFLTERMREVAILRSLGMQAPRALALYAAQVGVLGVLSMIPTILVSSLVLPFLNSALSGLISVDLQPAIHGKTILLALFLGVVGSLVICLPILLKIQELKPAKLFAEEKFSMDVQIRRPWIFLPGILMFWLLAITQANSIKMGSVFALSFFGVLIVLFLVGTVFLKSLTAAKGMKNWVLKYAVLGLARRRSSSLAIFVALGLGALLINILPQLTASLQNEFKTESTSKIPSLFMFDIQDDQKQAVQDLLKSENITDLGFSAMIRARILKVNGIDYERKLEEGQIFRTREEESEARFRNRGINLSYRDKISSSETIVDGKPFVTPYDAAKQKYAQVSLEVKYADRMGIKLGDIVQFDIQGVEVDGEVVNFRKVKWTSFQPNFFVVMQEGVLDDAPKTFITALPKLPEDRKNELQGKLAKQFSNVSIVDVQRTVNDVLKIADQMNWSLELMAFLALFTGYVVLYSIVSSQVRLRRWELNMLKVVGAGFGSVTKYVMVEFLVLAFAAGFIGSGLSIVVSYCISYFVFEGSFVFNWVYPALTSVGVCLLSAFVAFIASRRVVNESPLVILQEER
ncbi:MAG: FtsX-like permease family protein [Bdellovibrionaceae bacterium]|nr:FtsX-like permease family protein [Pseudobdellovibrionaceae bacterium]